MLRRKPNGFHKSFFTQNIFLKFTATTSSGGTLAAISSNIHLMSQKITNSHFKEIISGRKTKLDIYGHHPTAPDISILNEENKIIVRGSFEMHEDIVFEPGEAYAKDIFFDGGIYRNIIFRGGNFKRIFFRRGTYNGFVSIRGGQIENLILIGGTFNHWLGTLDGKDEIENGEALATDELEIKRFEIEGGNFATGIWIAGGKIDRLEIKSVTPIKIHCKPNDDNSYDTESGQYISRFKNSIPRIKDLIVSRYSNKDNFYHFSQISLHSFKFINFTNLGNITISKIEITKDLYFENSDLGKTTFIDCNFSQQNLFFDSSKITDISLAGALLPGPKNIKSQNAQNLKSQKRLALSQIKKVYQSMGDMVTAGTYQAEELNTYMSTLKLGSEKITLILNRLTNYHGQSWIRAFVALVISSSLFFTLYCLQLGFYVDFSGQEKNYFWENATYILEFINPIRKSEFLPKVIANKNEYEIPNKVILIDSIAKLVNAYIIFQFIAAFRKYGKKSE
ncbi:hypothetical protein [Flavobacterium wongokense]|uniref:hypothetical protein n=1 Tax=Flavobacterium wongokense TaxID=2910674 RepID=UPI001F176973|nr:hypothetical protein [Flavobacterium sp. WG47]MCF6132477.1 hypothetical protein [Flavobacterium sp. WG47]